MMGGMFDWLDFQGWTVWIILAFVAIFCLGIFGVIRAILRSLRRSTRSRRPDPSPPVRVETPNVSSLPVRVEAPIDSSPPPVQAPVTPKTAGLKEILSEFADVQMPLFFEYGKTEQASIQVENRTSEPLRDVKIDLADLAEFFEISSQSFGYKELKPGISLVEEFTMSAKKQEGIFPVVIRFSSGSVEVLQQWDIQVGGTQLDD